MTDATTLRKVSGVFLLLSVLVSSQAFAATAKNEPAQNSNALKTAAAPVTKQATHRNTTLGFTVTNYGTLGAQGDATLFDSFDGQALASFEFPLGSRIDYLFQGAIWVGGIVNGDTLVSVGNDGWLNLKEIFPSGNPVEVTAQRINGAAQEIIFNYSDTLTDTSIARPDTTDARPHKPLNLSFLQKSFVIRPGVGADSFALIYLRIQNIGPDPIDSMYVGILIDSDVGHPNTANYFTDDMAGFVDPGLIPGTSLQGDIACIWDNDGDPVGANFNANSPRGITGTKLLALSQTITKKSFNWWTPNATNSLDWGPQKSPGRTNSAGGRGQPLGDKMKYYYLSNGEVDYPQVTAAVNHTADGWLPPLSQGDAVDIANGFDARYLVSYGSFNLPAGDTLSLIFAAAVGKNLHLTANNFSSKLGSTAANYLDTAKINSYLRGLDFGSLIHNIKVAESLYTNGFVLPPPTGVTVQEINQHTARFFLPARSVLEKGFNIYRATNSAGPFAVVNATPTAASTFDDTTLTESQAYWYKLSTVSTADLEGPLGSLIGPVVVGHPQTLAGLTIRPDQIGNIHLSWQPPTDGDLVRFRIYRTSLADTLNLSLFDSVSAAETSYTDVGSAAGQRFSYRVTALDSFGLETLAPSTVKSMRFVFGNRLLLVNRTGPANQRPAFRDTIANFYLGALRRYDCDTLSLKDESAPIPTGVPPGFVSRNPVIYVHSSELRIFSADDPSFLSYFIDFFKAGGKLVMDGHWPLGAVNSSFLKCLASDPGFSVNQALWDTVRNTFGFDCLFFPRIFPFDTSLVNRSFLFAQPEQSGYPVLPADSLKAGAGLVAFVGNLPYPYPTVPNIGYLTNRTPSEDLYSFGSSAGAGDPKNGLTVAKKHSDLATGGSFVWFNFPLFYMQKDSAKKVIRKVLTDYGLAEILPKGDLDRNGMRTAADVVYLLNYVFLGQLFPFFDADEADMNCDGVATAADVVLFLNNVFLGTPLPCP